MKFKGLPIVAALLAAGTAIAGNTVTVSNSSHGILFAFDGSIASQPFRAQAGAPVNNTVAGVAAAGAPWGMTSFEAYIKNNGEIRGKGTGVLLLGTDNIGTRGGPRQVIVSLFCRNAAVPPAVAGTVQTAPYNSAPVNLDEDGDFTVRGRLLNADNQTPPADCGDGVDNRPVLLVRAVTPANPTTGAPATAGAWFAAGVIAPNFIKYRSKL